MFNANGQTVPGANTAPFYLDGQLGPSRRVAHLVLDRICADPHEQDRLTRSSAQYAASGLTDYLVAVDGRPRRPQEVFDRVRWGGQFIYVSRSARLVEHVARQFEAPCAFILEHSTQSVRRPRLGLSMRPFGQPHYFCVARKTMLMPPGQLSDRYSYEVQLVPAPPPGHGYIVRKQVPSFDQICARLERRLAGADRHTIHRHARKLTERVFPLFLTREAAFLKILQHRLPAEYARRLPRVCGVQTDERGVVHKLYSNWLRLGGGPISQLEFARQCAEMLHVLHEQVGVMHLDLRLDNVVVTDRGVGFVDFGSAVRVGEKLGNSPMLRSLFDEMMSTSQIQRVMGKLMSQGRITSRFICDSHQKIDKAVDLFYLALQMTNPFGNPDLKGLVKHDPASREARYLARLSDRVLRPTDPNHPRYTTARHLLEAIGRIAEVLGTEAAGRADRTAPDVRSHAAPRSNADRSPGRQPQVVGG